MSQSTRAEEGATRREALKTAFDWLQVYGLEGSNPKDGEHQKLDTLARELESFGRHVASAASTRAASAEAEVERLKARLEIDHAYDIAGNPIPFPAGMEADLDGIACRDETIRQQDEQIAKLTAERDAAIKVQEMCAMSGGFNARWAENATKQRDAAEASASALRDRVASLEAELQRLHRDNERLRWRHPAVLPEWNDLPDDMRERLAKAADSFDPEWGVGLAITMLEALRNGMDTAARAALNGGDHV